MGTISFIDDNGSFKMEQAENYSYLYFPVANDAGIKAAVTPQFGGDSKLGQNSFLMEPVSSENLHNNRSVRNFWCRIDGKLWSAVGASAIQEAVKFTPAQDKSETQAGFMWHTVTRQSADLGIKAEVTSFAPVKGCIEIMLVTLENVGEKAVKIDSCAAVPIYGRSADNIRDHRHVTSLLHRIKTTEHGVVVKPTLSFDERGHQKNEMLYYVCGLEDGKKPAGFYPVVEDFIGEGGSLTLPRAILEDRKPVCAGCEIEGREAIGGIRFAGRELAMGEKIAYTILMGITDDEKVIDEELKRFESTEKTLAELNNTKSFWNEAVNVSYKTGNEDFDGFMKWVSFQPFLRRIYGCSFLPHHDYGRGGRGWRDLWQDCLSLLIMDPSGVRNMILGNYCGVRIDGTNATIIGSKQGEFIADRNGIARVWMDHGMWPYLTTKMYIDQTGDVDVLKEKASYFKDEQKERGNALDKEWSEGYGVRLKDKNDQVYEGTVLEHILVEQLCAFYEVGEHNHYRLRGADWNDALDMAAENGESVAFTCAYAGNMSDLADMLDMLRDSYGWTEVELLEEIETLLQGNDELYESISAKTELLNGYLKNCGHRVSGKLKKIDITALANALREKAQWVMKHVRSTEWISNESGDEGWFNSYYDNSKRRVEGYFDSGVRMMLTGQVFACMSGTATDAQVASICESADKYLYEKEVGGYKLNTNFHEEKHDLGRAFGFSYGDKENGAVFSHMTVMYANALYKRGFVKEGYKALQTLADTAMNFETSKIYPGIPEYFNKDGRGMYHYLTGAASWYMLTFITEVFGVKGVYGDLTVCPKLTLNQFDSNGEARLGLTFAGKRFEIIVVNPQGKEYGEYSVVSASCDGKPINITGECMAVTKKEIEAMSDCLHTIRVELA